MAVEQDNNGFEGLNGKRNGFPVYTFETFGYAESGVFKRSNGDFVQLLDPIGHPIDPKKPPLKYDVIRSFQLQAYADALIEVFLEEYKPSAERLRQSAARLAAQVAPDVGQVVPLSQ